MNQKRANELRRLLLDIRRQADARLRQLRQNIADRAGDRRDVGDACEFVQEEVLTHTTALQADVTHDLRTQASEALQALNAGTYGICIGCGGEIPLKRLQAKPFATDCVPCREQAEAHALRPSTLHPLYA